jgi:ubiquinone/menaquinone biosynthesis C-methylase UbiE
MKEKKTSWGKVSDWYDTMLETGDDTYQEKVILPNLLRLLSLKKGEKLIDLGSGQGYFSRHFFSAGAEVVGVDISPELIERAKEHSPKEIAFYVSSAEALSFLPKHSFDALVSVLALQNMVDIDAVFANCAYLLKETGRALLVLNHPAFRIPKESSWGFDSEKNMQYRRVDRYLSESSVDIDMHPGQNIKVETVSFHRPLQLYFKLLHKHGFAVTRLEEWISHKKSEKGPRSDAEDKARKEIPLFLALEVKKIK